MAPLGPPPYTLEQIHAMTSPEARIRAEAELKSYIARLKIEKEEKEARERLQSNAFGVGYRTTSGNFNHYTPSHIPSYTTSFTPSYMPTYNQRGASRSRVRVGRGGRGQDRGYHHPYARPYTGLYTGLYTGPYTAPTFAQNAVAFNSTGNATEALEAKENEDPSQAPADNTTSSSSEHQQTEPPRLCVQFTSTGLCSRPGCFLVHDPDKQAVCKNWLYKGTCPKGDYCELPHTSSSHNAPTCLHFQTDRCTNDDCRFAHVRVKPTALNCEAFGQTGYCEKGDACAELHAYECPAFANTGECFYGARCRHPHVRRASRMRKASRLSSPAHSPVRSPAHSPSSNTPATSEAPEDDMDTAQDAHEWMMPKTETSPDPQQFTQQADFVAFETDE